MGEEMWHSSNKCDRFVSVVHVTARRFAAALPQCGDEVCSGSLSAGGKDFAEYSYKVGLLQ